MTVLTTDADCCRQCFIVIELLSSSVSNDSAFNLLYSFLLNYFKLLLCKKTRQTSGEHTFSVIEVLFRLQLLPCYELKAAHRMAQLASPSVS